MRLQNLPHKNPCSQHNCTSYRIMVSPCVPVPFPGSWIKNRWSASNNLSFVKDVPSPWVKGGECPIEEGSTCVEHGSSSVLQTEFSEGWTSTLMGYKILDERAKFTVYKILVSDNKGNWVIFRRYTDFYKLNKKLKELFPCISLPFPPKCRFKNKFDGDFLKLRQTHLQLFLEHLTLHKDMYHCDAVRYFLHLVNHPDLFESLDESRSFCESLEEMNHRLQRALTDKQRELELLKEILEKRQKHLEQLTKNVK